MCTGCGSSVCCVKGCQTESGLVGISKIFLVETVVKDVQQGFSVNRIEPRYCSNNGNGAEMFYGPFVISVAIANHDDTVKSYFCTAQRSHREQSVVYCAERRARGNQNRKSEMAR